MNRTVLFFRLDSLTDAEVSSSKLMDEEKSPIPEAKEEETLESLLEASRTPVGRSRLASRKTLLPSFLRLLPSSPPDLLIPRLRLLRNLCAGPDTPHVDLFLRSDGPKSIVALLSRSLLSDGPPELLRAGLQVLCNAALAGGDLHRSTVWAPLFPGVLLALSRIRNPQVGDPLCMLLDTCCSSSPERMEELTRPLTGLPILVEIITTASTVGYQEEWFEWLLSRICIEEPHFSLLFENIRPSKQAFLLQILSRSLNKRPHEVTVSIDFAFAVLKVFKGVYKALDFTDTSSFPTGLPEIDILGYSLAILRDICAWEDLSLLATEHPVNSLLSLDLLELLLTALGELGPPMIVRKSSGVVGTDPLKVCPYKGFRRDIVSVVANCLHRRKEVQDEVRERDGIFLLLQQCVVDEENEFLREWGLLAIRNLLEGNEDNQREVSELQIQGGVNTSEIAGLGLRVEVDEKSGRAKLVNNS